jgi:hypothetical protein
MLVFGVARASSPHSGMGVRRTLRSTGHGTHLFVTICFLACVFLLFVLVQWMRDTKRSTTTRPVVDIKGVRGAKRNGHLRLVRRGLWNGAIVLRRAHRVSTITERSDGRESWYDERERIAYERIAGSWKPGKRS